jgi:hypothetical protein
VANPDFTYRPRTGPVIAVAVWALAAWALITLAATDPTKLVVFLPAAGCAALTVWAVFWAPKVVVAQGAITVRNVLTTHHIPWSAITRIDTKWALTLYTGQRKIAAFAAPAPSSLHAVKAPSRRDLAHLPATTFDAARSVRPGDLPGTPSGDLAWVVRERWQEICDSMPTGPTSGHTASWRLHTPLLVAWAALAALTILGMYIL